MSTSKIVSISVGETITKVNEHTIDKSEDFADLLM